MADHTDASLVRRLGSLDAAAIIVSNVIGGGILFTPPMIAGRVPHPWAFLATWLVGGALALAGAMAYAELGAMHPKSGGEYVYFRLAYGRLAAFLTGWTSFVAGFTGAIAASAAYFAIYLGRFVPVAASSTPLFVIPIPWLPLTVTPQALVALAAIFGMAWIHLRGVGPGRIVSNVLASLKVTALVLFIAIGLSFGVGSSANLGTSGGSVSGGSWLLALIPIMFTYSGWNAAAYVAEEIRDPGRNLPRALALGTAIVIAIYFFLNFLYLYVLPIGDLAAVKGSVLDVIADKLLGARAGDIMGLVSIVSLMAGISAMTFAGPRVYYAMARDGVFFQAAGRVHQRYKTPAVAIIAQAVWAGLLVLVGKASDLTDYTGFAVVLFAGVAVAAVFVLRRTEPGTPRPFKALGYPWVPAVFVIVSLLIVGNAIYSGREAFVKGVIVICAGIPLYLLFTMRKRPVS